MLIMLIMKSIMKLHKNRLAISNSITTISIAVAVLLQTNNVSASSAALNELPETISEVIADRNIRHIGDIVKVKRNESLTRIAAAGGHVYLVTNKGKLLISADYGASFRKRKLGRSEVVLNVAASGNFLYAVTLNKLTRAKGLFVSRDHGSAFFNITDRLGITGKSIAVVSIAASGSYFYMLVDDLLSCSRHLLISSDNGNSFTDSQHTNDLLGYDKDFEMAAFGRHLYLFNTETLLISHDYGVSFPFINNPNVNNSNDLLVYPGDAYDPTLPVSIAAFGSYAYATTANSKKLFIFNSGSDYGISCSTTSIDSLGPEGESIGTLLAIAASDSDDSGHHHIYAITADGRKLLIRALSAKRQL
ncbi:MAG: hypothetical protein HQK53_13390 [Oligoflexia bacterium]|nr:hypothetical protein [Oligoflexia bacterium]